MTTYPNIYTYKYGDLYTLSAFANGVGNAQDNDLGSQLAVGAILGGLPLAKATVWDGPKWLFDNWGHYGETWNSMRQAHNAQKAVAKEFKGRFNVNASRPGRIYNWMMSNARLQEYQGWQAKPLEARISCDPDRYRSLLEKDINGKVAFIETEASKLYKATFRKSNKLIDEAYKPVRELLEKSKTLSGKELEAAMKELEYAGYHAELKVLQGRKAGTIKSVGRYAKAWNFIKAKSGYNKLNRGLLKGMTYGVKDTGEVVKNGIGAKTLRTVAKGAKGGGLLTAAIEMGFEAPEIVETYSKLGAGKGTKQLAKSAATATASAVGWVAGAKIGGILGAKAGAAIGTLFGPGIGTAIGGAIGGIIGVAGGIAGSWLCHKGMKSLMGKSELEKANDEKTIADAKKAYESPEGKKELLDKASKTAEANGGADQYTQDIYTKVSQEYLAETSQQTSEQSSQTYDYTKSTNGKSALLQQLESFNAYTFQNVTANPFNKQSIFS